MHQAQLTDPAATASRSCVTYVLQPSRHRRRDLKRLLEDLLRQWQLPARADRYTSAVAAAIGKRETLELLVQVDRVSELLTLELWSDGHLLYGLDDWIG